MIQNFRAATEQTMQVVLPSLIEEADEYFKKETSWQIELFTPKPITKDIKVYNNHSDEKQKDDAALSITTLDMVWYNIAANLQENGYNETEIGRIKILLMAKDANYNKYFAILEYLLQYCLQRQQPIYFMVTKAGKGKIIGRKNIESFYNNDDEDYYVNIPLHKILKKVMPSFKLCYNSNYVVTVSAKEKELLQDIHTNKHLKEVRLTTKNGEIQSAEYSEQLPFDGKKYADLLNEKAYQTLTIKRVNGKDEFMTRIYYKYFNKN